MSDDVDDDDGDVDANLSRMYYVCLSNSFSIYVSEVSA